MKKFLFTLIAIVGLSSAANAQFELEGSAASIGVAVVDSYDSYTAQGFGGVVSGHYDLLSGKGTVSPGADILIGAHGVAFVPNIKLGHDNINARFGYDVGGVFMYGIGGLIPVGDMGGISLSLDAGSTYGYGVAVGQAVACLLYTSPSPRDATLSRMPSSA